MKLPFVTWGRGETRAVFLHGFAGSSRTFEHLEPLLGDVLSATCLELPGHGQAPLPTSWDEVVDAVAEHLDGRTVLVGYSQGARIALGVAQKYPRRVERLVLESGAAGLRRRHDRLLRRRSDEALAELLRARGVDGFVAHWEQLPLFAGIRALPSSAQEALRARRSSHTVEGLAAALRVMGQGAQPDLWPGLQALRVPTLLITGAADEKYTRLARKMTADLPMAWRVSLRGVGHAPHLEAPEAYAAEVRSFLAPRWLAEPQEHVP
ncbi:MAG: 2-succinyl-6-hydroxy-2,4-cyclohexadiene-1-carboxylate synthase [Myxococcota bacterium]